MAIANDITDGAYRKIGLTAPTSDEVAAQGTITMAGIATAEETFIVDDQTFIWKVARSVAGEVTIGADAPAAVTNIVTAITADLETVTAVDGDGDTVVITVVTKGTAGNSIVFTEASTNMTVNGSGTLGTTTAGVDDETLKTLNNMISLFGLGFLVPYVTRESFSLVVGTAEYTIGSGGDFDTVRPISIINCYLKDSDGYSYDVRIRSAADYNRISLKTSEGRPKKLYFIPEYTLAKIIFSKEADATYTAYFEFWKNFTEFADLATTVSLPNEYKEAFIYNLAIRLAEDNTLEVPQSVYKTAETSLFLISRLNAVNRALPKAQFDFGGGSPSNITTGE